MTFSRAQMIEAFIAGSWWLEDTSMGTELASKAAERYVDSLQEAKTETDTVEHLAFLHEVNGLKELTAAISALSNAAKNASEWVKNTPQIEQLYRSASDQSIRLGGLDTTIREHILKTQERELVLAKIVGGLLFRTLTYPPEVTPLLMTQDWIEYGIEEINRVFPELTPEE